LYRFCGANGTHTGCGHNSHTIQDTHQARAPRFGVGVLNINDRSLRRDEARQTRQREPTRDNAMTRTRDSMRQPELPRGKTRQARTRETSEAAPDCVRHREAQARRCETPPAFCRRGCARLLPVDGGPPRQRKLQRERSARPRELKLVAATASGVMQASWSCIQTHDFRQHSSGELHFAYLRQGVVTIPRGFVDPRTAPNNPNEPP